MTLRVIANHPSLLTFTAEFRRTIDVFLREPYEDLPIRYKEMQLLTDMISGMTDRFCIDLHDDLSKRFVEMRAVSGTHN